MTKSENLPNAVVVDRLNEIIATKHISKADMARITGVSPQSVNGWFKRGSISKAAAAKLASATNLPISWILGEDSAQTETLSDEERRLLETFRKFPPAERNNMLLAFEMRLQELMNYYDKYVSLRK